MKVQTKKLTTAAVCTALAAAMCAVTAYLPLSFMPLYLAAFCIFLASRRGSLAYGLLCAAASIGLMFLMSGLSVKWLMFVLIFAPYGIVTVFLDKLSYFKVKSAIIRAAIAIVFFNVTEGAMYAIVTNVLTIGMDVNISDWVGTLGGYAVFAVIATVVLVPLDFVFAAFGVTVLKKIPARLSKTEMIAQKRNAQKQHDEQPKEPEYDIFGYEIKRDDADKDSKG